MKDKKEKKRTDKKEKKKNSKRKMSKRMEQLYQIGLRGYSLHSSVKSASFDK